MSSQRPVLNSDDPVRGLSLSVLDFWQWGFADVSTSRDMQAVVGSFLVATALGVHGTPRNPAGGGDLAYGDRTIAVTTTRSWQDGRRIGSQGPVFAVPPPRRWDTLRRRVVEDSRIADCYVFCLLVTEEPQPTSAQVLDAFEWRFWVVPTRELEREVGFESRLAADWLAERDEPVDHFSLRESVEDTLLSLDESVPQSM